MEKKTRGTRKLCMLPSHSCYIYMTWRSKDLVGFKVVIGREPIKPKQEGHNFYGGIDPSAILSELPTYFQSLLA